MLTLASVIGREFSLGTLGGSTGAGEDDLLGLLDEAMAAGVVSEVPDASRRLRFSHVLVRDTLYERLTTARRSLLHRRVVAALEALTGDDPGSSLAELAHHAIAGGAIDKGVQYARRAGDRALSLLAYEEAARWYLAALDHCPSCPRPTSRDAAGCCCPWGRPMHAPAAWPPPRRPSSRPPASRGSRGCRKSSPSRPSDTAGGSRGCAPAATIGLSRCSRRHW